MKALWLFSVAAISLFAAAQTVEYDAGAFIDKALQNGYEPRYLELQLQRASIALTHRAVWENPELTLERGNGTDSQTSTRIELSQPLALWGTGSQKAHDRHRFESAKAQNEASRHTLAIDAARLYNRLYFIQAAIKITDDQITKVDRLLAIAAARVDSGEIAPIEAARIAVAKEQLLSARAGLWQHELTLQSQARLWLQRDETVLAKEPIDYKTPPPSPDRIDELPDIRALKSEAQAQKSNLSAQKSQRLPAVQVLVFQEQTQGAGLDKETASGFGVGLSLPLWNQNRLAIEQARIDAQQSELKAAQIAQQKALLLNQERLLYQESLVQEARFTQSVERARAFYEAQALKFKTGENTLLELLDAHAFYLETRLTHNELAAQSADRYLNLCASAFVSPLKETR
ncbi:MAG: TolC family protein [Campylobacterales bacterium]